MGNHEILILTEAGKDIGLGHYTRCSSLRAAFEKDACTTNMVVYVKGHSLSDSNIVEGDWMNDLELLDRYSSSNLVIVDSYLAGKKVFERLKLQYPSVIAIDDYNRMVYPVDHIVNPNVFFEDINYSNQSAGCIGGRDFVILRPEFRNEAQLNESNATIENILITIGGSDFRQILPSIIESCLAAEIANIKVIAPTDAGKFQQDSRITVLPLRNAASMYTLMLEADVVISACGQTLHELAAIGRPIVGICLDIDQRPNQEYYLKEEVLQLDIKWDEADLKEKTRKNIDMLQSQEVRHSIIQKAQSLVNKDGVNIFVKYVKEMSR